MDKKYTRALFLISFVFSLYGNLFSIELKDGEFLARIIGDYGDSGLVGLSIYKPTQKLPSHLRTNKSVLSPSDDPSINGKLIAGSWVIVTMKKVAFPPPIKMKLEYPIVKKILATPNFKVGNEYTGSVYLLEEALKGLSTFVVLVKLHDMHFPVFCQVKEGINRKKLVHNRGVKIRLTSLGSIKNILEIEESLMQGEIIEIYPTYEEEDLKERLVYLQKEMFMDKAINYKKISLPNGTVVPVPWSILQK